MRLPQAGRLGYRVSVGRTSASAHQAPVRMPPQTTLTPPAKDLFYRAGAISCEEAGNFFPTAGGWFTSSASAWPMLPGGWRPPSLRQARMIRSFKYVLFPKPGWFIVHALAITLVFLLGYSVKF